MKSAKPATTLSSIPAEGEKKKSNAYKQDKEPISPFVDDSPNNVNPSSFEGVHHLALVFVEKEKKKTRKKFKVEISKPNHITSMRPPDMSYEEFTRQLFGSKIKHYCVTRSPLPSSIDKDKGISFDESTTKDFMPFMKQSGSA
ncbi:hypothetical protein Tco_0567646 [Tanacetum coccineum]